MTSQIDTDPAVWRRLMVGGVAAGALTAGLLAGVPTAVGQPSEPTSEVEAPTTQAEGPRTPCTGDDCKRDEEEAEPAGMTADQALSLIYNEYAQGDGGGQISKLIDDAVKLRSRGFPPSRANAAALEAAWDYRPNQTRLVEALKETIAYQRKLEARSELAVNSGGPVPIIVPPTAAITSPLGPGGAGVTVPIG